MTPVGWELSPTGKDGSGPGTGSPRAPSNGRRGNARCPRPLQPAPLGSAAPPRCLPVPPGVPGVSATPQPCLGRLRDPPSPAARNYNSRHAPGSAAVPARAGAGRETAAPQCSGATPC